MDNARFCSPQRQDGLGAGGHPPSWPTDTARFFPTWTEFGPLSGTVLCHWTVVSTGSAYRLCGTVLCHWTVISTGSDYRLCGTVQCHWMVVSTGSAYRLCGTVLCHCNVTFGTSIYMLWMSNFLRNKCLSLHWCIKTNQTYRAFICC